MTITIDNRSHHTIGTYGYIDYDSNVNPITWTHHGGAPRGALLLIMGETHRDTMPGHEDEIVRCSYGGITMLEVPGSPFVQTNGPALNYLDANGSSWYGHVWSIHAFFLGACVPPNDKQVKIELSVPYGYQSYQGVLWTYDAASDMDAEDLITDQYIASTIAINITTSHTAYLAACFGSSAAGNSGIDIITGTQTYEQDYGIQAGAWAESASALSAGTYSFSWRQKDPNFGPGPPVGLDLIMPCAAGAIAVYENGLDVNCFSDIWGWGGDTGEGWHIRTGTQPS